jgi:hypothetical protein
VSLTRVRRNYNLPHVIILVWSSAIGDLKSTVAKFNSLTLHFPASVVELRRLRDFTYINGKLAHFTQLHSRKKPRRESQNK